MGKVASDTSVVVDVPSIRAAPIKLDHFTKNGVL
jgi:hypothetical protein